MQQTLNLKTDEVKTENLPFKVNEHKVKLTLSDLVKERIEYTCDKISNTEWSGAIFYEMKGDNLLRKDLEITVVDMCLLDIGSSAYTEYEANSDEMMDFLMEHPEYMNLHTGLIH